MASNIFTGASRYSTDFQSVIDRSVNIASLPMLQMQQGKSAITDQSDALKSLDRKISNLQSAMTALSDSFGSGSYSVSNSDASILSAKIADGVTEGTYTVKVLDIGSYATTTSKSDLTVVSDPSAQNITSAQTFSLIVDGGGPISITPSGNNLNDLVQAINNANAGVRATVVNLSPSGTPEYHLSIQRTSLGSSTIQLTGDGVGLLDSATGGAKARYIVNGRVEESTSTSRSVTLSTGLTIELTKEGPPTATISVSRGATNTKTAIESFINNYNGVIDELNKHYGTQNGALSGNSIVFTANEYLRRISSYTTGAAGGLNSLGAIGIQPDKSGKLYLNSSDWDTVQGDLGSLQSFVGSTGAGGFLKSAGESLDQLHADKTGLITTAIDSANEQSEAADTRIAEEQRRIDDLRESLQKKFFAADALIASLEQQASYFTNMFAAMKSNQDSMS